MFTTRSKSLRSSWRKRTIALATPALFDMICRPPKCSTVKSTAACTWSALVMSVCWNAATSPEFAGERLTGVDVDIGDDDPCALLDEALHRRAADAARATGDDGDLSGEFVRHRCLPGVR